MKFRMALCQGGISSCKQAGLSLRLLVLSEGDKELRLLLGALTPTLEGGPVLPDDTLRSSSGVATGLLITMGPQGPWCSA